MRNEIAVGIIFLLLGLLIGYAWGSFAMLNWGVDKSVYFLELKGIEVDWDENLIKSAIGNYRENIDSCFEVKNASFFYEQGNEVA